MTSSSSTSTSGQVLLVKIFLSIVIIILSLCTLWYALVVYFEPESQIKKPLDCFSKHLSQQFVTASSSSNRNVGGGGGDFWIDKLALLGAKRAESLLFWDDFVDFSILLPALAGIDKSTKRSTRKTLLQAVGEQCELEVVENEQNGNSNNNDDDGIFTLVSTHHALSSILVDDGADNNNGLSSWWKAFIPRAVRIPGSFIFKAHVRFCQNQNTDTIACPAFHHNSDSDSDSDSDDADHADLLSINDVLPTNKQCMISGATTRCPRNVDNILKKEFGEQWKGKGILDFRKKKARKGW